MSAADGHGVALPGGPAAAGGQRGSRLNPGLTGMAIFIASEVMVFGAFFTAYFFVRFNIASRWPPLASNGKPFELPKLITGVNTAILVFSSFTVWYAEHSLRHGNRKGLIRGLAVTCMLGATFLIIQINEYIHIGFTPHDKAFGSVFYCLTGLHGAHVTVGLTLLTFALRRSLKGDFTPKQHTPLGAASIYWHFVDVVWVILYLLVYILV